MKTIKNITLWITLAVAIAFLTLGYASGQKVSAVAETNPIKWNMSLGEDISVQFTVDKSVGANACLKVSFDGKDEKNACRLYGNRRRIYVCLHGACSARYG